MTNVPDAGHILAQLLKQCSASRITPDATFELAKKRQNNTLFWGVKIYSLLDVRGKEFIYFVANLRARSQKTVKNLFVQQLCS